MRALILAAGLLFACGAALADTATLDAAWARQDYMLNCQGCHLPDGSGYAGKVPKLRGEVAKFLQVEGGREFLVRVPGSATSALADDRLARVLNWMLYEFDAADVPADFRPYQAAEVGTWRRDPYTTDVSAVRERLQSRIDAASPSR